MDPLTHTFTGAALALAGLRRKTPLATAALVVGANLPDMDGLCYFAGDYRALAFRRGWTHGALALVVLPIFLTAALVLWDRLVRRRRQPNAPPVRAGALLALSALAVATHPTLDWLNNYGLRWLMPFDGRWFYGDTLYIVDPWLWLVLGGALFLSTSQSRRSATGWALLWILMSAVVALGAALAPHGVLAVWFAATGLLVVIRLTGLVTPARARRLTGAALVAAVAYILALGVTERAARADVRAALAGVVAPIERLMVAPTPADPFTWQVIAATRDAYYSGRFYWLAAKRLELDDNATPRPPNDAVYAAAASTPQARRFLTWSRFPYVAVEAGPNGTRIVRFFDARYGGAGRLDGPTVFLDARLIAVEVH